MAFSSDREEALGEDSQVYWKTGDNAIYQVDGSKSFGFGKNITIAILGVRELALGLRLSLVCYQLQFCPYHPHTVPQILPTLVAEHLTTNINGYPIPWGSCCLCAKLGVRGGTSWKTLEHKRQERTVWCIKHGSWKVGEPAPPLPAASDSGLQL